MPTQAHPSSAAPRVLTALFGIVLMLAGYFPVSTLANSGSEMACCKNSGGHCHRHQGHSEGPQWQAQSCGMPGCHFTAHQPSAAGNLAGERHAAEGLSFSRLSGRPALERRVRYAQFSLNPFQLPPPVSA